MRRLVILLFAAALALTAAAGEPASTGKEKADPKLAARIKQLVEQLGDDSYDKRQAASKQLLEVGPPARAALEIAAKDKDAERSSRAREVLGKLKALPDPSKVDPKCTDGWQAVYEGRRLVQTFTSTLEKVDLVRIRVARTFAVPQDDLLIELRDPAAKKEAKPLAAGTLYTDWTDWTGKPAGAKGAKVTRFFGWREVVLKAAKLKKGEIYELVFSSKTGENAPWLVNCFYRDTLKGGQLRGVRDRKKKGGTLDMVFELVAGKDKLGSVPEGVDLTKKKEHFGLGHDGTDMTKKRGGDDLRGVGGFL